VLLAERDRIRQELKLTDATEATSRKQLAANRQRKQISTAPKRAHRDIFKGPTARPQALTALRDGAAITTSPPRIAELVEAHFTKTGAAPTLKHGRYLPSELPDRDYPFERKGAPDNFKLETPASALPTRPWLHSSILDEARYNRCVSKLKTGKTPGPDGVPNEVLKMLPPPVHELIRMMFAMCWATACTPRTWKLSSTHLLHKEKGSELDLKEYRPIGLAPTIYKLYTHLISSAVTDYAEQHSILSGSQSGFRRLQGTENQLEMMVMACEDARAGGGQLYAMMCDFSNAFGTLHHDDLLAIMYDLGFGSDVCEVVKDLYTEACTTVSLPHGATQPIPVERGTIQGDPLSPILWCLYLEPLLRWLQVGGRGYKFSCLQGHPGQNTTLTLSNSTFADDLSVLTNSMSDMQWQAVKISLFCTRFHLQASASKTRLGAALHDRSNRGLDMAKEAEHMLTYPTEQTDPKTGKTIRVSRTTIQGQPVGYLAPDEPFKLLGVYMTLTLNWSHSIATMLQTLKEKADCLRHSYATPQQAMRIVEQCIKTSVAYQMSVTPCRTHELELMDTVIGSIAKRVFKLPKAFPRAMLRQQVEAFGVGSTSMSCDYHYKAVRSLICSLNDPTLRGTVTKALLAKQLAQLHGIDPHLCKEESRFMLRARQLACVRHCNLDVVQRGTPAYDKLIAPLLDRITEHLNERAACLVRPLYDLPGVTSAAHLLEANGSHVLAASALKRMFGDKVGKSQLCALQRFTRMACANITDLKQLGAPCKGFTTDIPKDQRKVTAPWALPPTPAGNYIYTPVDHTQKMITAFLERVTQVDNHPDTAAGPQPTQAMPEGPQPAPGAPTPHMGPPSKRTKPYDRHKCPTLHKPTPRADQTRTPLAGGANWAAGIPLNFYPDPTRALTAAEVCNCKHRLAQELIQNQPPQGRKRKPQQATSSLQALTAMYNEQFRLKAIVGWQVTKPPSSTQTGRGGTRKNPTLRPSQVQYLVAWDDSLVDEWAVPVATAAGWNILHTERVPRAALAATKDPRCQCELCWGTSHLEPPDQLQWCSSCHKAFHATCVGAPTHPPPQWECAACMSPEHRDIQMADSHMALVSWQAHMEPADNPIFSTADGQAALLEWKAAAAAAAPAYPPGHTPDSDLPNMTKQNPAWEHNGWDPSASDPTAKLITFDHTAVNPHMDHAPTGKYEVAIRQVEMWVAAGAPPARKRMTCVTGPDGRGIGMLDPQRAAHLLTCYESAKRRGWPPALGPVGSFEEEVAALLLRYKEGQPIVSRAKHEHRPAEAEGPAENPALPSRKAYMQHAHKVSMKNNWTLPPLMMAALQESLGITRERLASPLDVCTATQEYWSAHKRDMVFGAQWDAYHTPWTGWNVAHPQFENKGLHKAVAWALASAEHAQTQGLPSATVLVLPCWPQASFQRYLHRYPGLVTPLLTFHAQADNPKRGSMKKKEGLLMHPAEWWAGTQPQLQAPAQRTQLVLVWNKLAKEELELHEHAHSCALQRDFCTSMTLVAAVAHAVAIAGGASEGEADDVGRKAIAHNHIDRVTHLESAPAPPGITAQDLNRTPSDDAHACACGDDTWAFPGGFGRAKAHADRHVGYQYPRVPLTPGPTPVNESPLRRYESSEHLARLPLRFDWRSIIYTDGSCQQNAWGGNNIGAGVVLPGADCTRSYLVAPGGKGVSNTINRAELAALHAALQLAERLGPTSSTPRAICTDSACSLALIRRALNDPNSLRFHKHKPILMAITELAKKVATSHGPMQLIKCKAHSGIVGNELADEAAAKAATKLNATRDLSCADIDPHPFGDGMYWVAVKDAREDAVGDETHQDASPMDDEERDEPEYLSDLRKDLDKHVRASCCTGAAKLAPGFYAKAWEEARKSALGDISNGFATAVPLAQRRIVWATRAGVLMNKKLEKRWFKRGDGNCPLCGQPDSCTHIASGCPKLSGLYTERHNKVARILLKAVLKGRLGANIVQADIGSVEKLTQAGLTLDQAHRCVPKHLLPDAVANDPATYNSLSRPDATLVCDLPPRIEVIEVKVCRDTDRSVQLERADKQHATIMSHIRQECFCSPVSLTTFAFGATGTIYKDNLDQLVTLGVDQASAKRALRKIHNSLVSDLHSIVGTRRAQEGPSPSTHRTNPATQPAHRTHKGRNR
jgi:ribonuclease HI